MKSKCDDESICYGAIQHRFGKSPLLRLCCFFLLSFFNKKYKIKEWPERCLIHCTHKWIFVPDALSIFFTQELASKLPPSKSRNGGPTFCVFTRSWFSVVGFVVWEVGCLRAVLTHLAYYVINVFKKKRLILG